MNKSNNLNLEKVNIPSYLTKVGEVIKVKEASANSEIFKQIVEANERRKNCFHLCVTEKIGIKAAQKSRF